MVALEKGLSEETQPTPIPLQQALPTPIPLEQAQPTPIPGEPLEQAQPTPIPLEPLDLEQAQPTPIPLEPLDLEQAQPTPIPLEPLDLEQAQPTPIPLEQGQLAFMEVGIPTMALPVSSSLLDGDENPILWWLAFATSMGRICVGKMCSCAGECPKSKMWCIHLQSQLFFLAMCLASEIKPRITPSQKSKEVGALLHILLAQDAIPSRR